jgi:hypothetical protein
MNSITLNRIIELIARMLEFVGVAVIGISFVDSETICRKSRMPMEA